MDMGRSVYNLRSYRNDDNLVVVLTLGRQSRGGRSEPVHDDCLRSRIEAARCAEVSVVMSTSHPYIEGRFHPARAQVSCVGARINDIYQL